MAKGATTRPVLLCQDSRSCTERKMSSVYVYLWFNTLVRECSYHSVSSSLLSKNIKIKIYRTIILPAVL